MEQRDKLTDENDATDKIAQIRNKLDQLSIKQMVKSMKKIDPQKKFAIYEEDEDDAIHSS